jgi:hypothetical protein
MSTFIFYAKKTRAAYLPLRRAFEVVANIVILLEKDILPNNI